MRMVFVILAFFAYGTLAAQSGTVAQQSKKLHEMLVRNDTALIGYLDANLSYGHSNGWIEDKATILKNLQTGYMVYHSIKEDSVSSSEDKKIGYVRFVADLDVSLNGKRANFRLKVLEVWRKEGKRWKLYVRQAVKA